ncbi:hypothetical protein FOA52_006282 [Chlamydomonas sp. UWO 241]|nr:hypothetical protein FOA52_006282 [Chlamydomonas sp. UWO 241]
MRANAVANIMAPMARVSGSGLLLSLLLLSLLLLLLLLLLLQLLLLLLLQLLLLLLLLLSLLLLLLSLLLLLLPMRPAPEMPRPPMALAAAVLLVMVVAALSVARAAAERPTPDELKAMAAAFPHPTPGTVKSYNYTDAMGENLVGYLALPSACAVPPPLILIVPDNTGISAYEKARAHLFAQHCVAAFVIDIYGNGLETMTAADHSAQSGRFRADVPLFKARIVAGVAAAGSYLQAFPYSYHPTDWFMAGYCFGAGGMLQATALVLVACSRVPLVPICWRRSRAALDGDELAPLKGMITFHASFAGLNLTTPAMLPYRLSIQQGYMDTGNPVNGTATNRTGLWELETAFKEGGGDYEIVIYSGAPHSFSDFYNEARYHPEADALSFQLDTGSMRPPRGGDEWACAMLNSYSVWNATLAAGGPLPIVLIITDWTGQDVYEVQRAIMLAEEGFFAIIVDTFASGFRTLPMQERIIETGKYRANRTLFMSRIDTTLAAAEALNVTDSNKTAILGFCFGGGGVVDALLSGREYATMITFHGSPGTGLATGLGPNVTSLSPLLVWSGSDDNNSESQSAVGELMAVMASLNSDFRVTRFSDTPHGFTDWSSSAYNAWADLRSWDQTMEQLHHSFGGMEADGNITEGMRRSEL